MRLYFMAGRPEPLLDPRDVPRGPNGYPLADFEVVLAKNAVAEAIAASLLQAYATGDFNGAFTGRESIQAPHAQRVVPLPAEALPKLKVAA